MPESSSDMNDLEQYLASKALGSDLLADFLGTRVFLSPSSGRTDDTTEEDDGC